MPGRQHQFPLRIGLILEAGAPAGIRLAGIENIGHPFPAPEGIDALQQFQQCRGPELQRAMNQPVIQRNGDAQVAKAVGDRQALAQRLRDAATPPSA